MGKHNTKKENTVDHHFAGKTNLKNLLVALVFFLLIFTAYKSTSSYKWIFDTLARRNMQFIKQHSQWPLDKKYEAKLGFDYSFVNYVKKYTPEDAIILMPLSKEFKKKYFNKKGAWGVKSKSWSTYFLYPRILIDEKMIIKDPTIANKLTHVM
ncbi:MAG: hypothetical protein U9N54_05925, partial [candidate division Zixibacteria bacterium]|nr:hypothetical protein [candidate division Zixibacteria bacterium]